MEIGRRPPVIPACRKREPAVWVLAHRYAASNTNNTLKRRVSRRQFIKSAALSGGAILSGGMQSVMADDRPIPVPAPRIARFERMAFGIFLHFGLYSQMERGEWTENLHKIPRDEYL